MAKQTLQEQFVAALVSLGLGRVVPSRSRKYIVLERLDKPMEASPGFFFVGKAGALRYGKTATSSFSASDSYKEKLLEKAKEKANVSES